MRRVNWVMLDVILLLCVGMSFVLAQAASTISLKDSLKNIKPAAGSCTQKEANKPKPLDYVPVDKVIPDLTCATAPEDLAKDSQKTTTFLVDTRTASDFVNYHIDGAMNMSVTALRNKTFLRDKPVVLMSNGKADRELYAECKRLKSNGFKQVKVLRGGMLSWLTSGQSVIGIAPNIAQLTRLTPSELWMESQFESNLVLVSSSQSILQKHLDGSVQLSDDNPKTINKAIDQRRKQSKSGPFSAVVLVVDKAFDFQTLHEIIKSVPLLVYYDSADAYLNYQAQQKAVWAAHEKGPKQPSSCGH